MDTKNIITNEELGRVITRIMTEEENRCKYNGVEFIGLQEDDIMNKLCERIGNNWSLPV